MMVYFSIICCGFLVGGAFATFYSALGVFSKLLYKTGFKKGYKFLALSMCFGLLFGSFVSVFDITLSSFNYLVYVQMLFGGVFIGIYFALLAEILKIIPLFNSLGFARFMILIAMMIVALGKLTGSLVYFVIPYFMT